MTMFQLHASKSFFYLCKARLKVTWVSKWKSSLADLRLSQAVSIKRSEGTYFTLISFLFPSPQWMLQYLIRAFLSSQVQNCNSVFYLLFYKPKQQEKSLHPPTTLYKFQEESGPLFFHCAWKVLKHYLLEVYIYRGHFLSRCNIFTQKFDLLSQSELFMWYF